MAGTVKVDRESQETVEIPITANEDPTTLPVTWAFVPVATPDAVRTYVAGEWKDTPGAQVGQKYRGVAVSPIIGTGTLDLVKGGYNAFVKVDARPPQRASSSLPC